MITRVHVLSVLSAFNFWQIAQHLVFSNVQMHKLEFIWRHFVHEKFCLLLPVSLSMTCVNITVIKISASAEENYHEPVQQSS